MREDILAAIEDHRIDLSKIENQKTMQYLFDLRDILQNE